MADREHIQIAHGGGGQMSAELIEQVILPSLGGHQQAGQLTDAALLDLAAGGGNGDGGGAERTIALTTDSYVVQPLEFPGGDIGKLAICGTINDLAVAGAAPKALSLSVIVQEGFEIETLRRLLTSAGDAARRAGVAVVTGDTKVVERGALDGLVINTTGVGVVTARADLGFDRIAAGDCVVLSGPLGEHGLAVMSQRKSLSFSAELKSDCASIHKPAAALIENLGRSVHFMRDPTRGGLAATLVEIATATGRDIEIREASIPVNRTAEAAAEMLGLDLLSVANEGKLVAVVADEAGAEAVRILAEHEIAREAAVIGTIGQNGADGAPGLVEMVTRVGGRRVVQMPYGEELPRIC